MKVRQTSRLARLETRITGLIGEVNDACELADKTGYDNIHPTVLEHVEDCHVNLVILAKVITSEITEYCKPTFKERRRIYKLTKEAFRTAEKAMLFEARAKLATT